MQKFMLSGLVLFGAIAQATIPGLTDSSQTEVHVQQAVKALFPRYAILAENGMIHTVATFPQVDYLSTFSYTGEFLWEIPFQAKIVNIDNYSSWTNWGTNAEDKHRIFVLSQSRDESAFFLSCIDTLEGKMLWERGIFAPKSD